MKISNDKAVKLLEELPLEQVSNESNFLAPLHTVGRVASIVCEDLNYGKRMIAGELGTEDVWWEAEYLPKENKIRVTGTVPDKSSPIRLES